MQDTTEPKQASPATTLPRGILDLKIPPPIVVMLIGIAMGVAARGEPFVPIDPNLRLAVAGIFGLGGLSFLLSGVLAFRKAKTTINPVEPEAASSVVTDGVYRYTRNPMYVGFAALLVGWALYLAGIWALLGPIVFVLFTTRFQIIPEERVLSAKFGQDYDAYRQQVRRWL